MTTVNNRIFALVWGGQLLSLIGSSAATFALSFAVYTATGRTSALAAVLAAKFATSVYLAPLAGALADHFPRRKVIISCDLILAGCSFLLAALITGGSAGRLAAILAVLALTGFTGSCLSVTLSASVRHLRGDADLTRVNGLISLLETVPTFGGPFIGAAAISLASPSVVFIIDGTTFLVASFTALLARWQLTTHDTKPKLRPFSGASSGLGYLWRDRGFRSLQLSFACFNFLAGAGSAVTIGYLLRSSAAKTSAWNLSLYNVASAAGLAIGAGVLLGAGNRLPRMVPVGGSAWVAGLVGRVGLGLTTIPMVWAASGLVRGIAIQASNTVLTALWQEKVPERIQGAVFGARRLLGQGLYPLALLAGGFLNDHIFNPGSPVAHFAASMFGRFAGPGGSTAVFLIALGLCEAGVGLWIVSSRHIGRLLATPQPAMTEQPVGASTN